LFSLSLASFILSVFSCNKQIKILLSAMITLHYITLHTRMKSARSL
jgi:hypothetical protein